MRGSAYRADTQTWTKETEMIWLIGFFVGCLVVFLIASTSEAFRKDLLGGAVFSVAMSAACTTVFWLSFHFARAVFQYVS
jgi:hypothetical protein